MLRQRYCTQYMLPGSLVISLWYIILSHEPIACFAHHYFYIPRANIY